MNFTVDDYLSFKKCPRKFFPLADRISRDAQFLFPSLPPPIQAVADSIDNKQFGTRIGTRSVRFSAIRYLITCTGPQNKSPAILKFGS